jgi:hypothetical protein
VDVDQQPVVRVSGDPAWEDLQLVRHWRAYLDSPLRYLRPTVADG